MSSYLVGAHLVDFAPCEMRWGLSGSRSILDRFVEGQQGEAELVLGEKDKITLRTTLLTKDWHVSTQALTLVPKSEKSTVMARADFRVSPTQPALETEGNP